MNDGDVVLPGFVNDEDVVLPEKNRMVDVPVNPGY